MLVPLRPAIPDADGQRRKHWTNCASSLKTSPSPRHTRQGAGVPAVGRGDASDLAVLKRIWQVTTQMGQY